MHPLKTGFFTWQYTFTIHPCLFDLIAHSGFFKHWTMFHCLDGPLVERSPTQGHLGHFQVLVIMTKAAMNIYGQVSVWTYFSNRLHKYLGAWLLGCTVRLCLTLLENSKLYVRCPIWHFRQHWVKVHTTLGLFRQLLLSSFYWAIPIACKTAHFHFYSLKKKKKVLDNLWFVDLFLVKSLFRLFWPIPNWAVCVVPVEF